MGLMAWTLTLLSFGSAAITMPGRKIGIVKLVSGETPPSRITSPSMIGFREVLPGPGADTNVWMKDYVWSIPAVSDIPSRLSPSLSWSPSLDQNSITERTNPFNLGFVIRHDR